MIARLNAFFCRLLLLASCGAAVSAVGIACVKYPPVGCILLAFLAWKRMRPGHGAGWSFGTASECSYAGLSRGGLLGNDGMIMGLTGYSEQPGRWQSIRGLCSPSLRSDDACRMFFAAVLGPRWSSGRMIRIRDYVHLATFAPAGSGKTVSVLGPNLLSYPGSCVVTDPKGELFGISARHRVKKFGHRALRLDPCAVCGADGASLNPLDTIRADAPDFLDACRDLANMLVVRQGTEPDPHWNDSAEMVLSAFIAFVCACESDPAKRTLLTVRSLISSRHKYTKAVEVMQQIEGCGGVVQRLGQMLTWIADKEMGSVLSTVQRHTAWMDSPAIAASLSRSSFDPCELRTGRLSLYLILPPERLVTLAPLMRMWLGTIIRTITRGAADERRTVVFFIDEAAQLGKMQILEDAVTLMRGYGIRLWLFFQSIDQVNKCFGDRASTILDNLATQQYFCINNSYESAETISKRIGDATIMLQSVNDTHSSSRSTGVKDQSANVSTSTSITVSETGRRLYKPEEVMTLPNDMALVFHKNLPVIPARLLKYYAAPEFRRGRTGRAAGLGLAGSATAALLLAACALLAAGALALPEGEEARRAVLHAVSDDVPAGGFGGAPLYPGPGGPFPAQWQPGPGGGMPGWPR